MAPSFSDAVGVDAIPELVRLGEQLAQARERAGLSPEALARRLRVEPRLLQALEAGDHSQLPEGVFIVALARRIASSLNVNVDDAIANVRQSRLMEHRPPGRSTPAQDLPLSPLRQPLQAKPPMPRSPRRPSPAAASLPWWLPLAALLTACGAAAAWLLLQQTPGRSPSSQTSGELAPAPAAAPTPKPANPPAGAPAPAATATATATPTPTPTPSESDTLRLLASEPSWVEVRDGDGRTVFEGTLNGEKRLPLGTGLEVIAGRPYAVRAGIGSSPPTPLGGVDDIRWKRFSPAAPMPKAPPAPAPSP